MSIPAQEAVSEVTKRNTSVTEGFSLRKLRTLKGAATSATISFLRNDIRNFAAVFCKLITNEPFFIKQYF